MKKKIILFGTIFILLIYSVSIFLIKNYFNNKCYCAENEKIIQQIKQDFIDEYNSNEDNAGFMILGQYNNGYILIRVGIPTTLNVDFSPKSIVIDNINIKYFPYTTFFYFEKGVIIKGLDNIYNEGYISKSDLINISYKFEQQKDYNYLIHNDYIVPYIFDNE